MTFIADQKQMQTYQLVIEERPEVQPSMEAPASDTNGLWQAS